MDSKEPYRRYRDELIIELENITKTQDEDYLYFLLNMGFYDGFDIGFSIVLCRLLEMKWHRAHEDIVLVLKDLKDPSTISCLYNAAINIFDYDEYRSLSKKCIWALGEINTQESKDKLRLLSHNDDAVIQEFALRELKSIE